MSPAPDTGPRLPTPPLLLCLMTRQGSPATVSQGPRSLLQASVAVALRPTADTHVMFSCRHPERPFISHRERPQVVPTRGRPAGSL